ncbi:MAG: hypothetical protein JWO15_3753 [Sphingomonadales bacterium]|nr:hypothetical protein [Sphingomonadales bacterium]
MNNAERRDREIRRLDLMLERVNRLDLTGPKGRTAIATLLRLQQCRAKLSGL